MKLVLVNEIRGKMVARGLTQNDVAVALGVSQRTIVNKFKSGIFGTDEAEKLIELLGIENPGAIFFAKKDT